MIVIQASSKARRRLRAKLNAAFLRVHGPVEIAMAKAAKRALAMVNDRVLGRVRSAGSLPGSVEEIYYGEEHRADFNRLLLPHWQRALWLGAAFENSWIKAAAPDVEQSLRGSGAVLQRFNENPEPPPSLDIEFPEELSQSIADRLKERSVGVWSEVSATVHKQLRYQIKAALEEGISLDEFAKRLKRKLKTRELWQAERIARTETTFLMNDGESLERDAIGIVLKEWVSTIDVRTRNAKFNHLSPNGQVRKNAGWFSISSEKLKFPGDKSLGASAGNVINCRCSAVSAFAD